jgi:hypothetical protein
MTNFHSFTQGHYIALKEQGGYSTLADLDQWQHKDIKDWCVAVTARAINRGGRTFGDLKIKQLQGIAWWATDTLLRNQVLDVNEYKANPDDYKFNVELDYRETKKANTIKVDKPEKFDYKKWIEWEVSVDSYFKSITNLKKVPMSYVIRKPVTGAASRVPMGRVGQIIYSAPLTGYLFSKDDETVGNIILECCLGTEAESWIKILKGGRSMMQALRLHYNGPDEAKKRLSTAKAQLDKNFYRHEATFSFEKYITALNDIFNTHEKYNERIYESDKLRYLLDKCQNNHSEFKQIVVLCRTTQTTFNGAVTMLKEAVGRLFPDSHIRGGSKKRNISQVNGKKGKGGGPPKEINGVDTSDLTRWFSDEEMKKLPQWMRKKIATNKNYQSNHKKKIDDKKRARKNNVSATATEAGTTVSDDNTRNSLIAAVINGIHNSTRQGSVQFPVNGRAATIASANRPRPTSVGGTAGAVDDTSVVTFDHLGNPI